MRLLGISALVLMCIRPSQLSWEGSVWVDSIGVHHLYIGEVPEDWRYPSRGYVLGIPLHYSTLTQDALEDLPGIGPALSSKILSLKETKSTVTWEDIDAIKGIGEKKLSLLKGNINLFD